MKWSDSGCSLQVQPRRCADGWVSMRVESGIASRFGPEQPEGWSCRLRWENCGRSRAGEKNRGSVLDVESWRIVDLPGRGGYWI